MARSLFRHVTKTLAVIAALTAAQVVAQDQTATNTAKSEATWRFAVSGDSRNCGDVVVPAIAADAKKQDPAFYWHLGDFRWIANIDEDMECGPHHLDGLSGHIEYGITAWKDFRENQIASFGPTPVFLGIGNHEMVFHKDREDFLQEFANWLDSPALQSQRLKDDPEDRSPHSYYHWVDRGVDFINLDNASNDGFSGAQLKWFHGVISRDLADASIKALVVGMHKALPDSVSFSHSMSESSGGIKSGRAVYNTLLEAQKKAGKHVYITRQSFPLLRRQYLRHEILADEWGRVAWLDRWHRWRTSVHSAGCRGAARSNQRLWLSSSHGALGRPRGWAPRVYFRRGSSGSSAGRSRETVRHRLCLLVLFKQPRS
jgi:hypothetical protein